MDFLYALGTVIGIAGTLILRDWRDGKNLFAKNVPPSTLAEGMNYMKHHYNDALTLTLTEIQVEQKEGFRDMGSTLSKINESLVRIEAGGVKLRT